MFSLGTVTLKILVGLFIFAGIVCLQLAFKGIKEELPTDQRLYMDPLPFKLKLIWPMVNFFSYYLGELFSVDTLEKINRKLHTSGISYLMTPEQFIGLCLTGGTLLSLIIVFCMMLLATFDFMFLLIGLLLGCFLPYLTLRDLRKKREHEIIRALPTYLDFLTMAVQAGMNMSGALHQAVEKGPKGSLNIEFRKVLRDMKAGMPRAEALKEFSRRTEVKEVSSFVTAVVQAEKTGASVGEILKIQADQRRVERFQRAEKLAMEAPVKLIFPLVIFIFPLTFLMLGFPIVMKFMYEL